MNKLTITSITRKDTKRNTPEGKVAQQAWIMFSAPAYTDEVNEDGELERTFLQPKTSGQGFMVDTYISGSGKEVAAHFLSTAKVGNKVQGQIITLPVEPHYRGVVREEGERVYTSTNVVFLGDVPTPDQVQEAIKSFNESQVALNRQAQLVDAL